MLRRGDAGPARLTSAFAPDAKQQFWINRSTRNIAANHARARSADRDVLQFVTGTTLFAVFPTGENDQSEPP